MVLEINVKIIQRKVIKMAFFFLLAMVSNALRSYALAKIRLIQMQGVMWASDLQIPVKKVTTMTQQCKALGGQPH